jgi:hypothetical protein
LTHFPVGRGINATPNVPVIEGKHAFPESSVLRIIPVKNFSGKGNIT